MWEVTLPPFKVQIWILVFSNIRTARSKDILLFLIELKVLNVLSIIDLIKLNTIATLLGVIKWILRLTIYVLKPNRTNSTLTFSSA